MRLSLVYGIFFTLNANIQILHFQFDHQFDFPFKHQAIGNRKSLPFLYLSILKSYIIAKKINYIRLIMEKPLYNSKLPNELCQQIFNHEFQIDVGNVNQAIISKTVELYVEAMQFFANLISQYSDHPEFDMLMTQKKHIFYQQKIKKLLSRNEVEKCLIGKKTDKKALDFEKQLSKIHENAPQQSRMLIEYFKNHHKNQQKLINLSLNEQQQKLNQRIRKRSISTRKSNSQTKKLDKIKLLMNEKLVSIA